MWVLRTFLRANIYKQCDIIAFLPHFSFLIVLKWYYSLMVYFFRMNAIIIKITSCSYNYIIVTK